MPTRPRSLHVHTILTCVMVLACMCLSHLPIYAQDQAPSTSLGLAISPPLNIIDLHERKNIVLAYTIENVGTHDLMITPRVVYFHADQATGTPVLEDNTPSFVTIQTPGFALNTPFPLAAGASQQLVLAIAPTLPPQHDLTFTLLAHGVSTDGTLDVGGSSVQLQTTVGANMIIRAGVSTQPGPSLALKNLHVPFIHDSSQPFTMQLLAQNTDQTSHQIHGTITMKRFGTVIETRGLYPDTVLAESTRSVRLSKLNTEDKEPDDHFLQFPWIPGRYVLDIVLADERGQSTSYSVSLLVFPFQISAAALFIIGCLGFIYAWSRRRHTIDKRPLVR